jgi:hypothetical protein
MHARKEVAIKLDDDSNEIDLRLHNSDEKSMRQ